MPNECRASGETQDMTDTTTKKKEARTDDGVRAALLSLEKMSTTRDLDNLARFGITATRPFGVSMANLKLLAKRLGPNHELAAALWDTGRYEARMLATLIDEPARVTAAQMERWCRDFDNWGICDTACFVLFDRTPHAWAKVSEWSDRRGEFAKRASFALLACLALHDKHAADERFIEGLRLIEQGATDERNFVKKGVSWAIRLVGRRNSTLNDAAVIVARRLSDSGNAAARWVGRGAVKELTSAAVRSKLAGRRRSPSGSKAAASSGKPTRRRIRE
jgi:3-methyladenine DNA glycosylase AlkD